MRILIIDIPQLPPASLNPNRKGAWSLRSNRKGYWAAKAAAKEYAYLVKMFALNERHAWQMDNNQEWVPLPQAKVTLEFTWPSDRRGPMPDEKNMEAAFKVGIDSLTARVRGVTKKGEVIVGAGLIVDDGPGHIIWQPTVLQRGPGERVRITVEEVSEMAGIECL